MSMSKIRGGTHGIHIVRKIKYKLKNIIGNNFKIVAGPHLE